MEVLDKEVGMVVSKEGEEDMMVAVVGNMVVGMVVNIVVLVARNKDLDKDLEGMEILHNELLQPC